MTKFPLFQVAVPTLILVSCKTVSFEFARHFVKCPPCLTNKDGGRCFSVHKLRAARDKKKQRASVALRFFSVELDSSR